MDVRTLDYYMAHAREVAQRYEAAPCSLAARFNSAFAPGGRVLDIGCGSGRDLAELGRQGFQPYGIDGTAEFVELAQEYWELLRNKNSLRFDKEAETLLVMPENNWQNALYGQMCNAIEVTALQRGVGRWPVS